MTASAPARHKSPLQLQIKWLLSQIRKQGARNDLVAVIVHMNDTYRIEDRPPDVPGLARIAHLIKRIKQAVKRATGSDRTLVLHSGDFLSPSLLSNTLKYQGEQMIELLKECEIDYITVGNHEFDFTREALIRRLSESGFTTILTNLEAPADYPGFERLALWPKADPILAIAGFVGKQTIEEAVKPEFGFSEKPWRDELDSVMKGIERNPQLGAFIALTHMGRTEDKEMQTELRRFWHKDCFAYVLGGHDHDIHWQEPKGNSILVKNYSNCRSVSVVVLTKTNIATPRRTWLPTPDYGTYEDELRQQEARAEAPHKRPSIDRIRRNAIDSWRQIGSRVGLRPDIVAALEVRLRQIVRNYDPPALREDGYLGLATRYLISMAVDYARTDFQGSVTQIKGENDWCTLPSDKKAKKLIKKWERMRDKSRGGHAQQTVKNFSSDVRSLSGKLEARDSVMRTRSTDFGNFVADAIKAATNADLALVNSGSFRTDSAIHPNIRRQDLWDAFIYDRADAIVLIRLDLDELARVCAHALSKVGQGGFLQVSEHYDEIIARRNDTTVAIIKYLLSHPGDGFQKVLTDAHGHTVDELLKRTTPGGSIVDLVMRGGADVAYCPDVRIGRSKVAGDDDIAKFVDLTDLYLDSCKTVNIHHPVSRYYLDPLAIGRPDAPPAILKARHNLRRFAQSLVEKHLASDIDKFLIDFANQLADCRESHETGLPYSDYFDAAVRYDWALRHVRTRFD